MYISFDRAGIFLAGKGHENYQIKGDKKYLKEISENVSLPLIRKDFVIDEYMIYDGKLHGASCVLLICSLLSESTIRNYIGICDTLGISALVEAHDEMEINKAIRAGARIIGVNNRDLKTFTVDISNSERLRKLEKQKLMRFLLEKLL